MTLDQRTQIAEARLYIQWAARNLKEIERCALIGQLWGWTDEKIAEVIGCARSTVQRARLLATTKIRAELHAAGIKSTRDLIEQE